MASALLWPSFKENYFKIWDTGASADAPVSLFHGRGCGTNSLSQSLSALPAPSEREPLAWR